ncbi:MAG: beta-lactamase family protein [Planctomycetes bacterium]|nr:beta-lactamase family protein [Planctomycetota bacterium]
MRTSSTWVRNVVCGLLGILVFLPAGGSGAQTAEDQGSAVDSVFAEWTDANSPGVAVAVVQDGRILFSRGYGLANLEYQVPVTPATAFDIGSIAKQFTAFAVALLVEQGKVSLDDDVRKYIPEIK